MMAQKILKYFLRLSFLLGAALIAMMLFLREQTAGLILSQNSWPPLAEMITSNHPQVCAIASERFTALNAQEKAAMVPFFTQTLGWSQAEFKKNLTQAWWSQYLAVASPEELGPLDENAPFKCFFDLLNLVPPLGLKEIYPAILSDALKRNHIRMEFLAVLENYGRRFPLELSQLTAAQYQLSLNSKLRHDFIEIISRSRAYALSWGLEQFKNKGSNDDLARLFYNWSIDGQISEEEKSLLDPLLTSTSTQDLMLLLTTFDPHLPKDSEKKIYFATKLRPVLPPLLDLEIKNYQETKSLKTVSILLKGVMELSLTEAISLPSTLALFLSQIMRQENPNNPHAKDILSSLMKGNWTPKEQSVFLPFLKDPQWQSLTLSSMLDTAFIPERPLLTELIQQLSKSSFAENKTILSIMQRLDGLHLLGPKDLSLIFINHRQLELVSDKFIKAAQLFQASLKPVLYAQIKKEKNQENLLLLYRFLFRIDDNDEKGINDFLQWKTKHQPACIAPYAEIVWLLNHLDQKKQDILTSKMKACLARLNAG